YLRELPGRPCVGPRACAGSWHPTTDTADSRVSHPRPRCLRLGQGHGGSRARHRSSGTPAELRDRSHTTVWRTSMSRLTIYPDDNATRPLLDTSDGEEIAAALKSINVRFERWSASRQLPADVDDAAVMEAYRSDIERLKSECGYQSVDVLRCLPDNPKRSELRLKFLDEHTHDDDEVRFFVEGRGVFYLRSAGKVHMRSE